VEDPKIERVLNRFKKTTVFFKILGSYPVGL
jgi:prephenate dehydratase